MKVKLLVFFLLINFLLFSSDYKRYNEYEKFIKECCLKEKINLNNNYVKNKEQILIPNKSIFNDYHPPRYNGLWEGAIGIGKLLSDEEKNKLPKKLLEEFKNNKIFNKIGEGLKSSNYIIQSFSNIFHNSMMYKPEIKGTLFLAILIEKQDLLKYYSEIQNRKDTNIVLLIPYNCYCLSFYMDENGNYIIIDAYGVG